MSTVHPRGSQANLRAACYDEAMSNAPRLDLPEPTPTTGETEEQARVRRARAIERFLAEAYGGAPPFTAQELAAIEAEWLGPG